MNGITYQEILICVQRYVYCDLFYRKALIVNFEHVGASLALALLINYNTQIKGGNRKGLPLQRSK